MRPTHFPWTNRLRQLTLAVATQLAVCCITLPAYAQSTGGLTGRVVDASSDRPVDGVVIRVNGGRYETRTNAAGDYQFRALPVGRYLVEVTMIGYRPEQRDSIRVNNGEMTRLDVRLAPQAIPLNDLRAVGIQDPVLDPLATATQQRVTAEDFRRLPMASLADATALQAGTVGESWRGGRVGQQALILDGMSVKNQLDASTGSVGLKIPIDLIEDATFITNGFSARFGQSVSGLLSVSTRDGGATWRGRTAYETDRPLRGVADLGLDRMVFQADGPLFGRTTAVVAIDLTGQLDADPVNAPRPTDPRDPRFSTPAPLPHNSGETWSGAGKLTIPVGPLLTTRLFGLASRDQRLLYDPRYKYDQEFGPGQRIDGTLLSASLQLVPKPEAQHPIQGEFHLGWYDRDFARGAVTTPEFRFGAFTGKKLTIQAEDIARARDTSAVRGVVPGFETAPRYSDRTPWGVPAYFLTGAPSGEISWNHFRELRSQFDATVGVGHNTDINLGGVFASQQAQTFQRILAYRPVGGDVPPATTTDLSPTIYGVYGEMSARLSDLGINAGIRLDGFDPGGVSDNKTLTSRTTLNPRLAISTAVRGASIVGSIGRFSQPPDIQYLVDAAFDDTVRTGRFRRGNPDLGFESALQFELSARIRLQERTSLKVGVYAKKLEGLVSSVPLTVNTDSSVFVNADNGDVQGLEATFEMERTHGLRARVSAVYQKATASVTDAFQIQQLVVIDPVSHDTIAAARSQFPLDYDRPISLIATIDAELNASAGPRILGVRPLAGITIATVGRYLTGLPYSQTELDGKTLISGINAQRLPAQILLDLLIRRPLQFGRARGGVYLDVRNVLNRANIISVRHDTGTPFADESTIQALTTAAYSANPSSIPYESTRYRVSADPTHTGTISGTQLRGLFDAATRDFTSPLFYFGPPRQFRFGMEVLF